ncbi:hypothetical protein H072_3918 [Dactylellina haptotyla CBS 200.50]|uniref:Ricin B lectin domain-containing protein n=1 Tax=Dactylellina haptotyla (strain CBS 200.50) TaxID=1284197 RepID=S8AH23_DACHA|nr:hypothetical protein H072_3918 [Dactylellina haptotyla CBS 200.50]
MHQVSSIVLGLAVALQYVACQVIEPGRTYAIRNVAAGTVLDVNNVDWKTVTGWQFNGGDDQKWTIYRTLGHYAIRNLGSGTYLGIPEESQTVSDGTPLICSEEQLQWQIEGAGNGQFRIYYPDHGRSIVVDLEGGGSPADGTAAILSSEIPEKPSQLWFFDAVV